MTSLSTSQRILVRYLVSLYESGCDLSNLSYEWRPVDLLHVRRDTWKALVTKKILVPHKTDPDYMWFDRYAALSYEV